MNEKKEIFTKVIKENLPGFRKVALGILRNVADADDAVQTALLKAWKSFQDLDRASTLRALIYKIVTNCCYDMLRLQERETELPEDLPAEEPAGTGAEKEARFVSLEKAIRMLPGELRAAVDIGVLQNLSGEEAASRLGCTANTLYQRIHRAKAKLAEILKQEEEE